MLHIFLDSLTVVPHSGHEKSTRRPDAEMSQLLLKSPQYSCNFCVCMIFQAQTHQRNKRHGTLQEKKRLTFLDVINYNTYSDKAPHHHTYQPYNAEKRKHVVIPTPRRQTLSAQQCSLYPRQPYTYGV